MEVFQHHPMPYHWVEDGSAWPFANDSWDPEKGADLFEDYLGQFRLADEVGFDGVTLNEHHFSAYTVNPSPIVTASHISAATEDLTIGFMGNVLPIRGNPIRVAEELAMLDNFSRGRVLAGFARGIPIEFMAYNVDPEESRARFAEAWDLIVEAWTAEEPFDFEGEFWEYEDVNVWPRPYQDPHPPLCMPASSEKSLRFAAERRAKIGQTFGTEESKAVFDQYRQIAEDEFGWTPANEQFMLARPIYVAETDEQAREDVEEHFEYSRGVLFAGVHKGATARMMGDSEYREEKHREHIPPHGVEAMQYDFDEYQEEGTHIVGDPEHVRSEIEAQYDEVGGFGTLLCGFQIGSLPPEKSKESMRLFADEVLPELRRL